MMNKTTPRMPHIGIVAGTAEGAALCYRILCQDGAQSMGQVVQPEITLHSYPVRFFLEAIDRNDWQGVATLMSESAVTLARAGADFIICPNNTLHRAFDMVESPIPWLHIAETVALEAAQRRLHRVGVLGTQIVMEGSVYSLKLQQFNITTVLPSVADRIRIQRIIRTELIGGRFTLESRLYLQRVIARMKTRGAEAVILACTELPLLITEEQSPLPLLDSTRLLAERALRYAMRGRRQTLTHNRTVSVSYSIPPIRQGAS